MIEYGATLNVGGAASSVLNKASNITLMNSSSTKGRLYIKFEGLNEQLRGKYVYYSYFAAHTANSSGSIAVGASKILGDWDENTLTWNTQPEISNVIYDEETSFASDGINTYTLTQWAKEIASGEIEDNYGIALSCVGSEVEGKYVNMYPLFTTGKLATFYVHYADAEEVDSEYDGSFQMESEITDENKVELSWDKFSDDVCEYNIYVRTANKFNLIGRTTELEYTVDESYLGDYTDIRVMAIEQLTNLNFYGAKNYLSQIISVEKFESTDTDEEGNEVTERIYEQNHFDTDGDGLEDGYEIWDLGTKWNEEVVSESTENTDETETEENTEEIESAEIQYVLDSDGDGFNDDYEVFILGTNPAVVNTEGADSDGDSLSDASELIKGTDPHLVDSDFDGTNDNGESKADARYTENSTSELKALNAEVYIGLYDFELTETEDGATITRLVNVYSGMEKKVSYNYGNTNLNKEKLYFYDENQNNTAVIEKINTYDAEDTSENEKNVICITYAYDDNGNNILICDQKTRYTMTYDEDGEMTEIKVGEISLMKYSSQVLQNNATEDGDTENIAVGGVIGSSEKTEEHGNGQKIRTVMTTYKTEDESEEEVTTEEETTQTEETQEAEATEEESTESNVVATKTEIFYNEDTQASYAAEYDAEGELIRFTDYINGSDTPVVYEYATGENGTTVSRSDGFTKTVTNTEDETNSISTDTTVYTFKDIKGTNRTYTQSITADASDDSDINMNSVMYSGDKSEYIFEYDNDITSKKIYQGQSDTVKLSMVETHNSATNATYAITDADGSRTLGYTYDLAGNITEISEGSTVNTRYVYDGHGRLLKETDFTENVEHEYVYNSTGNIKAHKVYAIDENGTAATEATQEIYFTHGNTNWPDRLTKYNGQSLTYDNSGNPLTYRDGLTFTWTRGRMLQNVKLNGADVASYKYNSEGLRTYKDTASSTTVYEWDGTNLIRETVTYKSNNNAFDIWYLYGGNGEIDGFVYEYLNTEGNVESQTVYYEKNIQGDVIALLNADTERIAEYAYDAWGNVTESTCEAGYELPYSLNHIGYRGYYRDTETGFYYLQSRYYDAVICRFINADDVNILQNSFDDMFKDNLYIYCNSNPINAVDYSGQWYYNFGDYYKIVKRRKEAAQKYSYGNPAQIGYIQAKGFYDKELATYCSNSKLYNKNRGWKRDNYIFGQGNRDVCKLKYGNSTIAASGCAVIAVYNLMKMKKKYVYFPQLISEYVLNEMNLYSGGTRFHAESWYFDAHKISYKVYKKKKNFVDNLKKSKYYLISTANANGSGYHIYAIQSLGNTYLVFNRYNEHTTVKTYTSIDAIIGSDKFNYAYVVY